jgi:hypothetical protein
MKTLFYSSLILPTIYGFTVLLVIAGVLFGFDIKEVIYPFGDPVANLVAWLTFGYVIVCLVLAWGSIELRRTKIEWSALLVLLNMVAVPWFLWCYNHGSLRRALHSKEEIL